MEHFICHYTPSFTQPTMKTKLHLLTATIALALGVTTNAANAAPYVRAGVEYTKFHTTANFDYFPDWEVGAVVEGGIVLNGAHSIGLEISYVESKSEVSDAPMFKTKKQQAPVLAAYRYTYAFNDVFSVYGGMTAGLIMDKYSLDTTNPLSSGSVTNWIPAAGGVVGVNVSLGGGWYLTGGARVLEVWQKTYRGVGDAGLLDIGEKVTYTRPTFTIGLGYKW